MVMGCFLDEEGGDVGGWSWCWIYGCCCWNGGGNGGEKSGGNGGGEGGRGWPAREARRLRFRLLCLLEMKEGMKKNERERRWRCIYIKGDGILQVCHCIIK